MNVDTNHIILLVEKFLRDVKKSEKLSMNRFSVTEEYKLALYEDTAYLLAGDKPFKEIASLLDEAKNLKGIEKGVYNLSDVLDTLGIKYTKGKLEMKEGELIHLARFYYHPELQETAKPARYIQLEDMSYQRIENEPFFLEMKQSYTIEDLTKFFIEKTNQDYPNIKGIQTQFYNMLPTYGLDLILYMIEASIIPNEDGRVRAPKSPRFLEDSETIGEAKRLLGNRLTSFKEEHIYGVTPRESNRI